MKNIPDGFYTNLFFAPEIILIFGGLCLHGIYRILKVNINCIRVPTTDFSRQNAEPGMGIYIQVRSVGRQEIRLTKATPKIEPLFSSPFQRI